MQSGGRVDIGRSCRIWKPGVLAEALCEETVFKASLVEPGAGGSGFGKL